MSNGTKLSKHILVYKKEGETPLQAINRLKNKYPEYKSEKIGYAGRLDPMAEGLLLLLIGYENKQKKKYENLSKVYECEVLLGVRTDTFDILGLVDNQTTLLQEKSNKDIGRVLNSFIGKSTQPYPAFSSKTVLGKPLYYWAREGKLLEITVPTKEIEIYQLTLLDIFSMKKEEIHSSILKRIEIVEGNFRQESVKKTWETFFNTTSKREFKMLKIRVFCSSGTYVRFLANQIGKKLNQQSLAFSITRVKIGESTLEDAFVL